MSENKPKVPPRPQLKASFLGHAQPTMQPADNMAATKTVDMTFRMDQNWHRHFKQTSVARDQSMKDLLIEVFDFWEKAQKS